jgi:hypothetical protein
MLHRGKAQNKTPASYPTAIAFSAFFKDKVSKLKAKAALDYSNHDPFKYDKNFDGTCFSFATLSEEQLNAIIKSASKRLLIRSNTPTYYQNFTSALLNILTNFVNASIICCGFPHCLKMAVIMPLIKKTFA